MRGAWGRRGVRLMARRWWAGLLAVSVGVVVLGLVPSVASAQSPSCPPSGGLSISIGTCGVSVPVPGLPSTPSVPSLPGAPSLPSPGSVPPVPGVPSAGQLLGPVESLVNGLIGKLPAPLSLLGQTVGTAEGIVNALPSPVYNVQTVYVAPSGQQVSRTTQAVLDVPTPVDVTGAGLPDVTVTLSVLPLGPAAGKVTVRVDRLPSAPASMPLSVQAVLPEPASSQELAFGYDATSSNAPGQFTGTLSVTQSLTGQLSATLDTNTAAAGPSLAVVADVITPSGSSGAPSGSQRVSLDYAPVPAVTHIGITVGPGAAFNISSDVPETVAAFTASFVDGSITASLGLQDLPTQLSVGYSPSQSSIVYLASAAVPQITALASDPSGIAGPATSAQLLLRQVPTQFNLTMGQGNGSVSLDAHGRTIGLVRVELTNGPSQTVPKGQDGVILQNTSSGYEVFGQIYGLQKVSFDQSSSGIQAQLDTTGGVPFTANIADGSMTAALGITDLPSQLAVDYAASQGTVSYDASAVVSQITASLQNPSGVAGPATSANLLLRQVPTQLDLTFGQANGSVSLNANGQTLGLIRVELTNGPSQTVPKGQDGVIMQNTPSGYEVFGQVYGLRNVSFAQSSSGVNAQLDTTGGVPFTANVTNQPQGGSATTTSVVLDDLAPTLAVSYAPSSGGANFSYQASQPESSLSVSTNAGGSPLNAVLDVVPADFSLAYGSGNQTTINYQASQVANSLTVHTNSLNASMVPVPANVAVCQAGNTSCLPNLDNGAGGNGTVTFQTSSRTVVNLTDGAIQVNNLSIHTLQVAYTTGQYDIYVFMNTNGQDLSSPNSPAIVDGNTFNATLPQGFSAVNRLVHYHIGYTCIFGCFPSSLSQSSSGSMNCPPGTQFNVNAGSLGELDVAHGVSIYGFKLANGLCS